MGQTPNLRKVQAKYDYYVAGTLVVSDTDRWQGDSAIKSFISPFHLVEDSLGETGLTLPWHLNNVSYFQRCVDQTFFPQAAEWMLTGYGERVYQQCMLSLSWVQSAWWRGGALKCF